MHFEAKVIVKLTGCVFLNHKAATATLPASFCGPWFGSFVEVSFCDIGFERIPALSSLLVFCLKILLQLTRKFLHLRQHWFEQVSHLFDSRNCIFGRKDELLSVLLLYRTRQLVPSDRN